MILSNGMILPSEHSADVLTRLQGEMGGLLAAEFPGAEVVVEACGRFADRLAQGAYDHLTAPLLQGGVLRPEQLTQAVALLSPESLRYKLRVELGEDDGQARRLADGTAVRRFPLGVLLHIAAGNVEALPAYSLIEGLLAGNVNLLKLPSADDGLSVQLLAELVRLEPRLAPYIHVFDTPSSDLATLREMAELCHAVVVWGGDAAVEAARRLAPVNARVIEWGHKLSFAYATEQGADQSALEGLARQIFATDQLLCSSCQGVFLDTDDMGQVKDFCDRFLPVLEEAARRYTRRSLGEQAWVTLRRHSRRLEALASGEAATALEGEGCTLSPLPDAALTASPLFGSLWVRPLPRARLVEALWRHKSHLQTAGLLCAAAERDELSALLARAGVTHVTTGANMSTPLAGGAHDGEYPLLRYTRLVEFTHQGD